MQFFSTQNSVSKVSSEFSKGQFSIIWNNEGMEIDLISLIFSFLLHAVEEESNKSL